MTGAYADLPLFAGKAALPFPQGWRTYVPVLQTKSGELRALQNASPGVLSRITPWIRVSQRRTPPKDAVTIENWAKKVSDAIGHRPFLLDVLRPAANARVATKSSGQRLVVEVLFEAARKHGLSFIPVVQARSIKNEVGKASVLAGQLDGRGLALVSRIEDVVADPAGELMSALKATGLHASQVDLIVDAGYLGEYEDDDLKLAARGFATLAGTAAWRNVVLLGTSIPKTMSVVKEGTTKILPRREWELWRLVRQAGARVPAFGDYVIQHPVPPQDGGPGMRANIRYTLPTGTFVARGGEVLKTSNAEYRVLCNWIVASGHFKSGAYSWGDQVIEECAQGRIRPGAQDMWRGAGTSHHLAALVDQIRRARV